MVINSSVYRGRELQPRRQRGARKQRGKQQICNKIHYDLDVVALAPRARPQARAGGGAVGGGGGGGDGGGGEQTSKFFNTFRV